DRQRDDEGGRDEEGEAIGEAEDGLGHGRRFRRRSQRGPLRGGGTTALSGGSDLGAPAPIGAGADHERRERSQSNSRLHDAMVPAKHGSPPSRGVGRRTCFAALIGAFPLAESPPFGG